MTRRRLFLLVLLAIVVLVTVMWPRQRESQVNRKNFDLLRDDMSRAEVERILGFPRDESTGILLALDEPDERPGKRFNKVMEERFFAAIRWDNTGWGNFDHQEWVCDDFIIFIIFDDRGVLREKRFMEVRKQPEGLWKMLRKKLGL